jgi:hypothetical protein
MKDKKIYFLLLLPLVVFLGLIVFLVVSNFVKPKNINLKPLITTDVKKESNTPTATVTSLATGDKIDGGKILENAKSNKNPAECLKIADKKYALACLQLLAQSLQDEKICSNIENPLDSAKCLDEVVYTKAISNKDISLCPKISEASLNQSCVVNVVQQNSLKEKDCQSLPDKEKGYCLDYLKYIADSVIFDTAKSADDCQKIAGETAKAFCLDKFK